MKRICRHLVGAAVALLWLAAGVDTLAQEIAEPDYDLIRQSINNSKSPNFYSALARRYLDNDTTLSLEHYRHLYYGFSLQEDFVPYQSEKPQLFDVRRRLAESGGNKDLCPEAIRVARSVLDDNPFDILAISTISIASLQMGDTLGYVLWRNKQQGLIDAILSSGDGDSPATAFHVIAVEHEYEVLTRLGLEVAGDSLCSPTVEYLRVKPNADGERGFYFNFGACRRVYDQKYTPK